MDEEDIKEMFGVYPYHNSFYTETKPFTPRERVTAVPRREWIEAIIEGSNKPSHFQPEVHIVPPLLIQNTLFFCIKSDRNMITKIIYISEIKKEI